LSPGASVRSVSTMRLRGQLGVGPWAEALAPCSTEGLALAWGGSESHIRPTKEVSHRNPASRARPWSRINLPVDEPSKFQMGRSDTSGMEPLSWRVWSTRQQVATPRPERPLSTRPAAGNDESENAAVRRRSPKALHPTLPVQDTSPRRQPAGRKPLTRQAQQRGENRVFGDSPWPWHGCRRRHQSRRTRR